MHGSVVVVDDDDKLVTIMARALQRAGYECRTAASGDQALWAVGHDPPDAVVLDVMIPHPSGVEVCRHLRATGYDGAIVMVSARSAPGDRAAVERAGADRFLPKPFGLAELVGAVDELVDGARHAS